MASSPVNDANDRQRVSGSGPRDRADAKRRAQRGRRWVTLRSRELSHRAFPRARVELDHSSLVSTPVQETGSELDSQGGVGYNGLQQVARQRRYSNGEGQPGQIQPLPNSGSRSQPAPP